jgi:predicted permease
MNGTRARLFKRCRDLFRFRDRDRDIQEELEFHFDAIVEERKRDGMTEPEARLEASRRFGRISSIKDRGHDERGAGWIDAMSRDLRQAARRLLRAPAFSVAAVLTLALAIGANASIFTVVHRVVWNPLPYDSPDRLIALDYGIPARNLTSGMTAMTWQLYWQLVDRARSLESIAVYGTVRGTLTGGGNPERVVVSRATPSLMRVLGGSPAIGRWFTEEEGVPGSSPAAVLSYGLWMRRFGGDPGVLDRAVTIDGISTSIVGIMPPSFAFPSDQTELWMPAQSTRSNASFLFGVTGVARLSDNVTVEEARAEITALIADLSKTSPNQAGIVSAAVPLQEMMVGRVKRALWTLLAAVGVVLLVACANVANLFLVRNEARQREIAVRLALGAGRRGVVRYFFAESVLLSVTGGALGLTLAWAGVRLLVAFSPANLPRLGEVRVDAVVVLFTCALIFVSALVFCAIPLVRQRPVAVSLHETGRGSITGRGRHRWRHVLMGSQVALALMLLIASALMIRSFQKLRSIDLGFDSSSVLTFNVGLPERQYVTREAAVAVHQAILERLSALPGVTHVSASSCLPLSGTCFGNSLRVESELDDSAVARGFVWFRAVADGYFETMGMRLLRGRWLSRDDIERKQPSVVVNQAFANAYFSGRDPIGERIQSYTSPNRPPPRPDWLTIVGVVSNTPTNALAEPSPTAQLFMPMSIAGGPNIRIEALIGPSVSTMSYVIRSVVPPEELAAAARAAISDVDPNLALAQVRPMQDIVDRASDQMAFMMTLLAIAAAVALLLGIVGIYGVVSYVVSQRTSEIGVRLALGAKPQNVVAMIAGQGGLVALAGAFVGLTIAFAGGRLIESLLYGVSPRDPFVFIMSTVTLLGIALLACWLPARRASRINPVVALRAD